MRAADKQLILSKIEQANNLMLDVFVLLDRPAATRKCEVRTLTPPMPKPPRYKGDTGLVRKALWDCGWFNLAKDQLFNDKRENWSRIKLWFADRLFEATQAEQQALETELRKAFGDRIIKMGFVAAHNWSGGKSFCIWLKP